MEYSSLLLFLALVVVAQATKDEFAVFASDNNKCEERNVNSRIIGGEEAVPHSYPYQVGMFLKVWGQDRRIFCGGSILNEYYILTAAHCVFNAYHAEVIVGAHNIHEDEPTQQRFNTTVFIVHKRWNKPVLKNDIAIVRVPRRIQFSAAVQPIQLPKESDGDDRFAFKTGTVAGWGVTTDKATEISPVLLQLESRVTPHIVCNMFFFGRINKDQICLDGWKGKSICSGDSGGPMVILDDNNKPVQHGIVSFGIGFGCEKGWPQVFTKVSKYLPWIYEHTGIIVAP